MAVPAATPVAVPLDEPTVTVPVALLVQRPPEGEDESVVVAPSHTFMVPVMVAGVVSTVTDCDAEQLPAKV